MKKQAFALAFGLLLSIAVAGVCYAQQPALVGNVPFAFQVGNKTLPAGEYRIERAPTGDGCLQLIRQQGGHPLMFVPTMPVDPKDGKSEPVLIFNHYGNSYFLSQIWTGTGTGRQLFKSNRETELALNEVKTETEVALLGYSSSVKR
ncbi:MAG: hypothetical protein WBC04_17880 [Candidatus Acidiferrales bacterium]